MTFFALVLKKPMLRMRSRTFVLAERHHLARRVGEAEELARRLVDAGVGRLRRQDDGDEQRVGVDMIELALRLRIALLEAAEDLRDLGGRQDATPFGAQRRGRVRERLAAP